MIILSKTRLLSLSFLLSCSYLLKPILASDEGKHKYVKSIPRAGSQSLANQSDQEDEVWPNQQYRLRLSEVQKEQKALGQKIIIALTAKEGNVEKIRRQVKAMQKKDLPESFKGLLAGIEWLEPYEMFNPSQLCDLITRYNPTKLAPLEEIINSLKRFCEEWDNLSGNTANALPLALDQTLWYQEKWNDLLRQINDGSLTGAHIYEWLSYFQKTLQALEAFRNNLAKCHSILQQDRECLATIDKNLTRYLHLKNTVLWKCVKFFFNGLPEYDLLPKNFFLNSKHYGWITYLRYLSHSWPTSWVCQRKELIVISEQAEKLGLEIKDKEKLTEDDKVNLGNFWEKNGRKFWELLKNSTKNLPEYDDLLENLYPDTSNLTRTDTDIKFLLFLQILDLYNKPLDIAEDLALEFEEAFTPSPSWSQEVKRLKVILKPFANIYGIIKPLQSLQYYYEGFINKYQPNFGKTYDHFIPDALITLPDGRQLSIPQSIACQIFPNLHLPASCWLDNLPQSHSISIPPLQCLHFPEMDGDTEYAWYFLEKLWGLPSLPFTVGFFENILVQRVATSKTVEFGNRLDIRNMDRFTDHYSKINYQREARVEGFLKDPSERRVRSESAYAIMQEQFTGISLQAFLEDVAKGVRSFAEIDRNSFFRQALFTMLTQSSVPPENWGLIKQNGKLVLVRIHDGTYQSKFTPTTVELVPEEDSPFKNQYILTAPNILFFLPFANEEIPPEIREEFLSHDILLILSFWMTELTKAQQYFDTCRQQKESMNSATGKETQNQVIEESTIRLYRGMLKTWIENFEIMQGILQYSSSPCLTLLQRLRSTEFKLHNGIFQQNTKAVKEQKATLFFHNVLLPAIQNNKGFFSDWHDFQRAIEGCLQNINSNSDLSIEKAINQISQDEIKYFFLSIYARTKNRDFVKAHVVLKSWEDAIKQKKEAVSLNKAFPERVQGMEILEELVGLADISGKTPDQQIEILSLLLELLPDTQSENAVKAELEKPSLDIQIFQDIQSNPGTPEIGKAINSVIRTASLDQRNIQERDELLSLMLTPEQSPKPQLKRLREKNNVDNTIGSSKIHRSWENLVKQIVSSSDLSFLKKFLAIPRRLWKFFDQSVRYIYFYPVENGSSQKFIKTGSRSEGLSLFQKAWNRCTEFPTVEDRQLKELLVMEEYNSWQSIEPVLPKNRTPEEVAGQLFRLLFQGSLKPAPEDSLFLNALCDLLLLPRYAGSGGLPKDLSPMAAYLESTGFGCNLLERQYLGRSKSSHSGPISIVCEDGHFYVLTWSARCVELFQSPKTIPGAICQTIMSLDAPLLCLHWLDHLQKRSINLEFYPWFIPTLLEKIPQMQKLMVMHPYLTFSQVMEIVWPALFAAYRQKFKVEQKNSPESICKGLESSIESRWDLTIVDTDAGLDWTPQGHDKTLEDILEESSIKQAHYRSQPPLSIPGAATEVISHSISHIDQSRRGKELLKYGPQLHIDGRKVSSKLTYDRLCSIIPQSPLEVQKTAIALYLGCPVDGIDVTDDSLKISGLKKGSTKKLFKVISFWFDKMGKPLNSIKALDLSNNQILSLKELESLLKAFPYLEELILNDNPIYDTRLLGGFNNLQRVELLRTYVPALDEFNIRFRSQEKKEKVGLYLMSELPSNGKPLKNKMYAGKSGRKLKYKVLNPNGRVAEHTTGIQVDDELTVEALNSLKPRVLNEALEKGHIIDKKEVKVDGDGIISYSDYGLSAEEAKDITAYYFEQLVKCWDSSTITLACFNDFPLTYFDVIPTIMLQLSQNFWEEALVFAKQQKAKRLTNQSNKQIELFLGFLDSLNEDLAENKVWVRLFANMDCRDPLETRNMLLKLIFAWKYDLPGEVAQGDLIWHKTRGSYSLRQLHLGRATAQTYLDILAQYEQKLKTLKTMPVNYLGTEESKTFNTMPAYLVYSEVMALAASQLAEKHWDEALASLQKSKKLLKLFLNLHKNVTAELADKRQPIKGYDEESDGIPQKSSKLPSTLPGYQQTPQKSFPSFNALKLAFAWKYGLPPGTQRDSLVFASLPSIPFPSNMDHPYCLTNIVISGFDLSRSSLEFLPNFSGAYSPKLCRSPMSASPKASRSPTASRKEIRIYTLNGGVYYSGWGQEDQKAEPKDFEPGYIQTLNQCVQKKQWQSKYDAEDLLKFTLLRQHTFSGLTNLALSHCQLTSTAFVPKCNNLMSLNLSHNQLQDLWGLFGTEDSIFKFPQLESLDVSHNLIEITPEDWRKLRKPISQIKEVDMSHNQISIAPVMLTYPVKKFAKQQGAQEEKSTCFKINHNNIKMADIHQFYDFKFFVKREAKGRRTIIPQKNNQHPIHIFQMDSLSTDQVKLFFTLKDTFPQAVFSNFILYWRNINKGLYFQIYQSISPQRLMKARWDISDYDSSVVEKLRNLTADTNLSIDDRENLISLVLYHNPDYLNTAHLQVTPSEYQG